MESLGFDVISVEGKELFDCSTEVLLSSSKGDLDIWMKVSDEDSILALAPKHWYSDDIEFYTDIFSSDQFKEIVAEDLKETNEKIKSFRLMVRKFGGLEELVKYVYSGLLCYDFCSMYLMDIVGELYAKCSRQLYFRYIMDNPSKTDSHYFSGKNIMISSGLSDNFILLKNESKGVITINNSERSEQAVKDGEAIPVRLLIIGSRDDAAIIDNLFSGEINSIVEKIESLIKEVNNIG